MKRTSNGRFTRNGHSIYGAGYNGFADPITANLIERILANQQKLLANMDAGSPTSRQWFQSDPDPRRSIYDECGYPWDTGQLQVKMFKDLFDREPVANKVVSLYPREAWKKQPVVYEDESPDNITDFEEAIYELDTSLRGEKTYYKGQDGSPINETLRRGQILSGVGHFGVILLGFDDGKMLDQPVEGVAEMNTKQNASISPWVGVRDEMPLFSRSNGTESSVQQVAKEQNQGSGDRMYQDSKIGTDSQYLGIQFSPSEFPSQKPSKKQRKLLFMRAYSEDLVQIVEYEADARNPRFSMPKMYRITLNDPREVHSGIGLPLATVRVHWSRIIHLADNYFSPVSSIIFHAPRIRPVLNPILDIIKVRGGSAEMYWKGALMGLAMSTHQQLGGEVDVDPIAMQNMFENYQNGLQRYLLLKGMDANVLTPTVVDPTPQVLLYIQSICIHMDCPQRVFMGSERGELASSQDDENWNERVNSYNANYTTPGVLVQFYDRMIAAGVLPEPGDDGYFVEWPDIDSLGDKDKAGIALQRTQAMAAYVQGGVEQLVPRQHYLTKELDYTDEEADEINDDAEKQQEEQQQMADEQGFEPEPPDGFQKPEPEEQQPPIKVKPGEKLVNPQDGSKLPGQGNSNAPGPRNKQLWGMAHNALLTSNGWVTLESGQHVFIGDSGGISPTGPKRGDKSEGGKKGPATKDEPEKEDKFGGWGSHAAMEKELAMGPTNMVVARGGQINKDSPNFFSVGLGTAAEYGEGRGTALYKLDPSKVAMLHRGNRLSLSEDQQDELENMGPELHSDPPKWFLAKLKEKGYNGYTDGSWLRLQDENGVLGKHTPQGIQKVKPVTFKEKT